MSFEINPVLAGKFDTPDYGTANNIGAASSTSDVTGPDSRRYTQFDHSVTDAGSTTDFSFSDLVDMLNPLEHIPIVSSIYRAITNEQINPISRVAGDILYGGAFGVASAVFGGVGAMADTELVAETGKDSGGLALAALFGPDETQNPIQLADAGKPAAAGSGTSSAPQTIELTQAAATTPKFAALDVETNAPGASQNIQASNAMPAPIIPATPPSPSPANMPATGAAAGIIPLLASAPSRAPSPSNVAATGPAAAPLLASVSANPVKQPFGGVMGPPNIQAQGMAMALAQGAPSMRLGNMIYTGRLANGAHALPPMLSSGASRPIATPTSPAPAFAPPPVVPASFTSVTSMPAADPTVSANLAGAGTAFPTGGMSAAENPLPPELIHDMMLKALDQYKSIAAGPANTGGVLNLTN